MKVQIAFDLNANGVGDFFTLDDPVKGLLGTLNYPLAGDALVDVTDTVTQVSVKRGRNRQLDKFTAGTATVIMLNMDRIYDPTNTLSPYFGSILPRKEVTISDQDQVIYTGQVEDWNFNYALNGLSTAQVNCVDGLTLLVDPFLSATTQTAQTTGERVQAVLDDVAWPPAKRLVSIGNANIGADLITANTTKALDYLNKVSLSEPGALYIKADGNLVFRDRSDLQDASGSVLFGTGGIPFSDIEVQFGIEEMANQIEVNYLGGSVTVSDTVSIEAYGTFDQSYDTLLDDLIDAENLAAWQIDLYSQPQYRVEKISILLHGLEIADQQTVLGLELGDVVTVTWTPNNVGDPLTQITIIDAIEYAGTPSGRSVSFKLSQTFSGFIIGSSFLGTGLVGF